MADTKITDLTEDTTPLATDLLVTVDDPGGSPVNKKATIANVIAAVISAWAKAATKPTYANTEVGAAPTVHTHVKASITDFPTSMPASDVSAWAKAASKPSYSAAEVSALPLAGGMVTGSLAVVGEITAGGLLLPTLLNFPPVSAGAAGTLGEIQISSSGGLYFLYACVATNHWVRIQLSTW